MFLQALNGIEGNLVKVELCFENMGVDYNINSSLIDELDFAANAELSKPLEVTNDDEYLVYGQQDHVFKLKFLRHCEHGRMTTVFEVVT